MRGRGTGNMKKRISELTADLEEQLVKWRRDLHRNPEPGWMEFRTASIVIDHLTRMGFRVMYGPELFREEAMMGLPTTEKVEAARERARSQGVDEKILAAMADCKTGVVGVLETGKEGPTVGFRFDMDALELAEACDQAHRPFAEGFASVNPGVMHACGHDAHTAIGLGLATILGGLKDHLKGRIKLVFQPAEEGGRGAKSMAEAGIVDDVDYMMGIHVGLSQTELGQIVCGADANGFTATTKVDVTFRGKSAHAGQEPELGRNTLLAAAMAVVGLHGISRHGGGSTRVNVGTLVAGSGRNIIPSEAKLAVETRGATSELDKYMLERAYEVINGAAVMQNVTVETKVVGAVSGGKPSEELANRIAEVAKPIKAIHNAIPMGPFSTGGSDDYAYFMTRVQEVGGQATCIVLGTELAAGHHNPYFDINEGVLTLGVELLAQVAYALTTA
jgi:aminobenzoyl-glutamate utilization protein A